MRNIDEKLKKIIPENIKVVVVDDDAVVLFLHKNIVEQSELPSPALFCKNGQEALEIISAEEYQNTHFLVLLDINMPVMNGWEFLEEIQKEKFRNKIRVAMVSSSINSRDIIKAHTFPQVIKYLHKPLMRNDCDELSQEMEQLLNP